MLNHKRPFNIKMTTFTLTLKTKLNATKKTNKQINEFINLLK